MSEYRHTHPHAYNEGYAAYGEHFYRPPNPYGDTPDGRAWTRGYQDACDEDSIAVDNDWYGYA